MKKRRKKFRLNVVIQYYSGTNPECYRMPIHEILMHLAWMYGLEYWISVDHKFSEEFVTYEPEQPRGTSDLIYYRSTDQTRIVAKDLRQIISCIFDKSSLLSLRVEVFCLVVKLLPKLPFPQEYFRPLGFPFVESHSDGEIKECVYYNYAEKILLESQTPQLN